MKKKLLQVFLMALIGLIGNSSGVWAQSIPEPNAQWNFNNAEDLMAPDKGSLKMIPAVLGKKSITLSTLSDAGIEQKDGPSEDNKSIFVPTGSALKVERAEGAKASQNYTILMDIMVTNPGPYDGLFQTKEENDNDGDLFIHENKIGIGSFTNGGYFGNIQSGNWYRVVLVYRDGQNILYLDGKKLVASPPDNNDRFKMMPFGFYLFCDEDGEKQDNYVSQVAFWETSLSDKQVSDLGSAVPPVTTQIGTAEDLLNFAQYVNEGNTDANAVLTSDITLTEPWETPIGIDGKPYSGIFDGQGYKITGFNGTGAGKYGLFGFTSSATIKNFSIDGTLTVTGGTGTGTIGWSTGSVVSNVHSTLAIAVTEAGAHHVAGIVGSAQGNNTISGCSFAGSMTIVSGNSDNFAGIVGYLGGDCVEYCGNYGTVTYADLTCCAGGITAYINNTASYVKGCLNMGKVSCEEAGDTPSYGSAIVGWLRSHDANKLTDNCWLEGSAYGAGRNGDDVLKALCFTEDKVSTGAICYALNGNQKVIGWYQTLGTDNAPVLDRTHGQVYLIGRMHCNGDIYDNVTYSNTYTEPSKDDHHIIDGFCDYCGLFIEDGLTPNANGFYEIANAKQLTWFSTKVNKGTINANAILTADIGFATLMPENADPEETEVAWLPIGDWNTGSEKTSAYAGHFDGQGHSIANFNATSSNNFFGLFGVLTTGAFIENFSISGRINTKIQHTGSVAAYARDAEITIRNINSSVDINNIYAGGRQGGILGGAYGSLANIENCTYSGTLGANDSGGSGNYGGILGYPNSNSAVVVNITNCLFDGTVKNTAVSPGNCTFGGIVGYCNSATTTIKNCLSIGTVESTRYSQFYGALNGNNSNIYNSYYQGDNIIGSGSSGTAKTQEAYLVSDEQLEGGEVAWKLNEESFLDPVWHQILGEERCPLPYGEGFYGIVYQTSNKDYEIIDPDDPSSVAIFISNVIENENEFIENTKAYQKLLDAYTEEVESWDDIDNLEEFFATYKAASKLKKSIKTSEANYVAYVQACESAANYLSENTIEGEWCDLLQDYLQEDVEPNSDYPNGSHIYIMENLTLDDEAIIAEIAFVNQMLENAIAGGITAGTEITRLMINANFKDGYEGWNVEFEGGTATVAGNTEIMPIPEAFNNKSFNASQTLTGLPNGIYMMALNGLFRSGTDVTSQFYAGQLYLNNTYNYFMSQSEDVIPEAIAEPGVNCLGENSEDVFYDGDVTGWVPNSRNGCSVAFNAGRYQNFCATEVTDSTLTVGMRNLTTGHGYDWMPFGNLHVFYIGTKEEANESLTEVLNGYKDRAEVILNYETNPENVEPAQHPNMSEALKDQLRGYVNAIPNATTGNNKMELINNFSATFNEVNACRKAYIAMYNTSYQMFDLLYEMNSKGLVSEDLYNEWNTKLSAIQMHYEDGDVTTEEALAFVDEMNDANLIGLPSVNGIYQLASANDLILFAGLVNYGLNSSDAVLVNDIDMNNCEWKEPIGFWGSKQIAYKGHFDGQGYSIKNFNAASTQNFFGLFGVLSTNAIVENFSIYGEVNNLANQTYMGVIGYARDENVNIRDIHSYVDFINTTQGARQGGVLGCADNGQISIDRCTYSGKFQSQDAGGSGNYGGIVGYANNNSLVVLNITDCLFDGQLINTATTPGNCTFGGIVGYCNSATTTIKNCLSIGSVESAKYGQFFGALNGVNSKIYNSYYQGEFINGSSSGRIASPQEATKVSNDQLASGEVCYKLNGDQNIINWYQTLDKDNNPVLEKSHLIVVYDEANARYRNANQDDIDGINLIPTLSLGEGAIYDLSGRKINSQLKKGIYIVNGKKVLY